MDVQEPLWYMSWSPVMMGGDHNVKQNKTDSGAQILYFFSFVDHRLHIYIYFPEEGVMKVTSSWGKLEGEKRRGYGVRKWLEYMIYLKLKKIQCLSKCLYVCCMFSHYLPAYYIFSIL